MRRDDFALNEPPANDRPGSRWMCGRDDDSSPCSHGPNVNGTCPLAGACRPRRTWLGRRKQIVTLVLASAALITFFMCRPGIAPSAFKPGDLSTPHSQILSSTRTSDRCAACHHPAAFSPESWFDSGSDGHRGITQSDRCLDCHHNVIRRDRANLAHNVPESVLASMTSAIRLASTRENETARRSSSWHDLLPGPAVDSGNVQCSACHREHRGSDGDLLNVSDSQCQTCHADRFGSFATSHPSWNRWPYGRGGAIAFDHRSHANKHYPSSAKAGALATFDCSTCHRVDERGELARAASYELACKSCHDPSLQIEAAQGLELLALPTIPSDSASRLDSWPESATGYYDGRVAPLAQLLMRPNPAVADATRHLPGGNIGEVDANDPEMVEAARVIASEHRVLLGEIAGKGQLAVVERASRVGIPRDLSLEVIRALPPQLLRNAYLDWFVVEQDPVLQQAAEQDAMMKRAIRLVEYQDVLSQPPSILLAARPNDDLLLVDESDRSSAEEPTSQDDLLANDGELLAESDSLLVESDALLDGSDALLDADGAGDALLEPDALGDDSLSEDPLADSGQPIPAVTPRFDETRFDANQMLPAGGWYRDDLRMTISYRGAGHFDPVLRSTIEMLSQLPPSDPVRKRLLATRAINACVTCHTAAANETGKWRSLPLVGRRNQFTKFAHGPHLHIAQLADCTHCHAVSGASPDGPAIGAVSLTSPTTDGGAPEHEFRPMKLENCASCHTAQAAGDNCTKCHRYHIDF